MVPVQITLPGEKAENPSVYKNNHALEAVKKTGLAIFAIGLLTLFLSLAGVPASGSISYLIISFGLTVAGALIYFIPQIKEAPAGIKNNKIFFNPLTSKGTPAWIIGVMITAFYVILYWFPYLISNWIRLADPLSLWLSGKHADRWFLYGMFYTIAVLVMGIRMMIKYRHNRYQIIRTLSVSFFQLGFAFLIPAFLERLNRPEYYFTYFWPLKYNYLFPGDINYLIHNGGALGYFMVFWGIMMILIAAPVLTYFFGKRWYCSWVCGCGALAETAGDPFRQNSDKSLKAWKIERLTIYSVLAFIIATTALLWLNFIFKGEILGPLSNCFSEVYGFLIGSIFSGVVGVGFYPIMGSRVWCRFGCPMAAILGILQKKFSRFRITVNGGQCISCGNCSVYCEMGIDVKWYAQRGQNIIRASCVGCGICSAVCPRGVLKLENLPMEGRYNKN